MRSTNFLIEVVSEGFSAPRNINANIIQICCLMSLSPREYRSLYNSYDQVLSEWESKMVDWHLYERGPDPGPRPTHTISTPWTPRLQQAILSHTVMGELDLNTQDPVLNRGSPFISDGRQMPGYYLDTTHNTPLPAGTFTLEYDYRFIKRTSNFLSGSHRQMAFYVRRDPNIPFGQDDCVLIRVISNTTGDMQYDGQVWEMNGSYTFDWPGGDFYPIMTFFQGTSLDTVTFTVQASTPLWNRFVHKITQVHKKNLFNFYTNYDVLLNTAPHSLTHHSLKRETEEENVPWPPELHQESSYDNIKSYTSMIYYTHDHAEVEIVWIADTHVRTTRLLMAALRAKWSLMERGVCIVVAYFDPEYAIYPADFKLDYQLPMVCTSTDSEAIYVTATEPRFVNVKFDILNGLYDIKVTDIKRAKGRFTSIPNPLYTLSTALLTRDVSVASYDEHVSTMSFMLRLTDGTERNVVASFDHAFHYRSPGGDQ